MLEGLKEQIAALGARDLSFGAAGLGPEIVELFTLVSALTAQGTRFLAAYEKAEGFADEQLTVVAWLRAQTTLSAGQAHGLRRIARVQDRLPKLAAVYAAGQTTPAHLTAVAAGIRDLPTELWDEVDAGLAIVARALTAQGLAEWLRERKQVLHPDKRPKDETQREQRRLSVRTGFAGMTDVHGRLTPEVGEKFKAALSALSEPDTDGEVRLPNQRTADALERLLDVRVDSGELPVDGGERPHITLTVDLDTLAQPDDHTPKNPFAAGTTATTSGLPRFAWTGPTSRNTARRLACDGIVLPIFTRGDQVLDVGRRNRVVSSALRAFVIARDKTCRWPGCDRPARWSQVHHVRHWSHGGSTDRANLILICDAHHHAAHDGRWTIILERPGQITVRRRRSERDPYYVIKTPAPPPELANLN